MNELTDEQIKAVIVAIDPDEQYMPKALAQFARAVIAADRAQRKDTWREAIDEARLSLMLDITAPDANPAASVKELVSWANELALNPAISSDAQALIDRGIARQAERHAEELRAYEVTVANLKQDRDVWAEWCTGAVARLANLDQRLKRDAMRHAEELAAYEVTVGNLREQAQPVATLHDDGYWTWKQGRPPYESHYAGWRMDVYAAPQAQPAPEPERPAGVVIFPNDQFREAFRGLIDTGDKP
jgi:hypothetical protein